MKNRKTDNRPQRVQRDRKAGKWVRRDTRRAVIARKHEWLLTA